ncbi:hypothetical protein D3C86_1107780 [compost metagenome]
MGRALLNRSAQVLRTRSETDDPDIMDRLEAIVLKHNPKSFDEAATMLDVVAVNVSTGQRCDGLDIRAVEVVAAYLRSTICAACRAAIPD